MRNLISQRRGAFAVIAAALVVVLMAATPASAQQLNLDTARAQGLVGEMRNGLIGALVTDPAVIQLVEMINIERLEAYQSISRAEQTPLSQVQAIAGQKIYDNVPPGTYIRDIHGRWIKK